MVCESSQVDRSPFAAEGLVGTSLIRLLEAHYEIYSRMATESSGRYQTGCQHELPVLRGNRQPRLTVEGSLQGIDISS